MPHLPAFPALCTHRLSCRPLCAHLTIVFAALAVARWLEAVTGTTLRQLVRSLRRYRTIDIQAGDHIITAEDPLPPEIEAWLDAIHGRDPVH